MKRILITGANGQLGQTFKRLEHEYPAYKFIFASRSEIDIAQEDTVKKIISIRPDVIINCAAYTAVDKAEGDKLGAKMINEIGPKHIVEAAEAIDAIVLHYSSDYVYHIKKKGPIKESDTKRPHGIYAKTKWRGDKIVSQYKKHLILRTSWVFASEGNNFVNTMLRLSDSKDELTIVADQWGSPTFTDDLVHGSMAAIETVLTDVNKNYFGTYNYSNEGLISWYDFASTIFALAGKKMLLHKTTTLAYNAPAPRPQWSFMNKNKFKKRFKTHIPHWYDALRRCLIQKGL